MRTTGLKDLYIPIKYKSIASYETPSTNPNKQHAQSQQQPKKQKKRNVAVNPDCSIFSWRQPKSNSNIITDDDTHFSINSFGLDHNFDHNLDHNLDHIVDHIVDHNYNSHSNKNTNQNSQSSKILPIPNENAYTFERSHRRQSRQAALSNSYQYARPVLYEVPAVPAQRPEISIRDRIQRSQQLRQQTLSREINDFKNKILERLPEYENVIDEFGIESFYKYYVALKNEKGIENGACVLDLGSSSYAMPVWDPKRNRLNRKKYEHCMKSRGTGQWLCECAQWELWDQQRCIHTLLCLLNISSIIDIANDIANSKRRLNDIVTLLNEVQTGPRSRNISVYSVRPQSRFDHHFATVYKYTDGQMSCDRHPTIGQNTCGHKHEVTEAIGEDSSELRKLHHESKKKRIRKNRIFLKKPFSYRLVPVPPLLRIYWPGLFDDEKEYPEYDAFDISDRDITTPFCVEVTNCIECGQSLEEAPLVTRDAILYRLGDGVNIELGAKKCLKCGEWNHFDGYKDHIMNRNGIHCYDHALMWSFWLTLFYQPGTSINAFHTVQDHLYRINQSKIKFPTVTAIWDALKSFYFIVNVKHELICGFCDRNWKKNIDLPPSGEIDHVGTDGVQCGCDEFDADLIVNPKHIFDPNFVIDNIVPYSNRFIVTKNYRKLLRRYLFQHLPAIKRDRASNGKGKKDPNYLPRLTEAETLSLKQHLRQIGYGCVVLLMIWLNSDQYNSLSNRCKQYCADWFRVISTDEPVHGCCPSKLCDILIGGQDSINLPANKSEILRRGPLLHCVLFDMGDNFQWGKWFYDLLKLIGQVSKQVLQQIYDKIGNNGRGEERPATPAQQRIWDNYFIHGTRFSGKAKRTLPSYTMDLRNEKNKQNTYKRKIRTKLKKKRNNNRDNNENENKNENESGDDSDSMGENEENRQMGPRMHESRDRFNAKIVEELPPCKKNFIEQNNKPAMMVFRCVMHGTCVGTHMMTKQESPLDIACFLYVMYSIWPLLLVADFICHGHPQMLARAPAQSKDVICVSDEPHDLTHTGCSMVYFPKYHKTFVPDFFRIKDVCMEQRHLMINKMRKIGVWAYGITFTVITAWILEIDNRRIHIQIVGHKGVHRNINRETSKRSWADDYNRFNDVQFAGNPNWDQFLNLQQLRAYDMHPIDGNGDNDDNDDNDNIDEEKYNQVSIHNDNNNKHGSNNNSGNDGIDWYDRLFNDPNLISGDEQDLFEDVGPPSQLTQEIGKLLDELNNSD